MFHIFKKVYLEYDYKFEHKGDFITASSRLNEYPMQVSSNEVLGQYRSFESMLDEKFESSVESFWAYLYGYQGNSKLVVFVSPDIMTQLQVQYWKHIFSDSIDAASVFKLHTSWVETVRLYSYMESYRNKNLLEQAEFKNEYEISQLFNNVEDSVTLLAIDKSTVSFEYLLADYMANNRSKYKTELFKKIEFLTWDNWVDELEHLKYEILSGNIDAEKLDPTIKTPLGGVEGGLKKSKFLSWTVDPRFKEGTEYIRATYPYTTFDPCWVKLAEVWSHEYDDMSEVNYMINHDDYPGLLLRDIARNYGCSYTRTRFMDKCNQVFATYCYDRHRKGSTKDLSKFILRK